MPTLPDGTVAAFVTESDAAPPDHLRAVDDSLSADDAVAALEQGHHLLWVGDFHNGRQLLKAVERRLVPRRRPRGSAADRWRATRGVRRLQGELLGRILVAIDTDGRLDLRRAPDTRRAITLAWGPADGPRLLAFRTLLGALGAAGWTGKGLDLPHLDGRLVPRFGVFSPTRHAYLDLLDGLDVTGRTVLDVGTGTGVLALILLQRGAASAVGTDIEPRAVACAADNARRLGLADRFEAVHADLFPADHRADVVVFNPPWLPEAPRTRLDRAIFDPAGRTLTRFLTELPDHLADEGVGVLLLSDIAERIGLRDPDTLPRAARQAGLRWTTAAAVPASHKAPKADDPLSRARAGEQIRRIHVTRATH